MLSRYFLDFSVDVGFCHRSESDIFLFLCTRLLKGHAMNYSPRNDHWVKI